MKKVTVVGVGALGSHFVQFMRSEDVEFKLIDFDRVEQKNTLSQFHGKPGVGKLKVQGLQSTLQLLWGMKTVVNTNKLVEDNAHQLLGDSDLIVDCLDNAEARRVVQNYVRSLHAINLTINVGSGTGTGQAVIIPCVHGAVDGEGSFGRVVWDEGFVIDSGSAPGTPTCEDGENLPFIASVAAYLARSAQGFLRKGVRHGFQISPGGVVLTRT
jgi:molybdopterin-synthase adenylyltransferase